MAFVYILQAEGTTRVKIGRAMSVQKRKAALHTASPFPLRLVGFIETAHAVKLERALHKRYAAYRQHGEWFDIPDTLLQALLCEEKVITDASDMPALPLASRNGSTTRIEHMLIEGKRASTIAKELRISASYVYRIRRGIRNSRKAKPGLPASVETDRTRYIKQQLTNGVPTRIIAKELEISRSYVYRLKRYLGV